MRLPLPALAAALLSLSACKTDPAGPGMPLRSLTSGEASLVRASNVFAFDLLRDTDAVDRRANLFISPLSASMALGMTMNGTAGATYTEMRDMLGYKGMADAEINESYRSLIALLRGADRHVDFRIANSIWYAQGFEVLPSFLDVTRTWFSAEVAQLDFASPQSVTRINDWVSASTAGRIPTIVDQISPDAVMFLINAIYFKGAWTHQFDPKLTMQRAFRTPEGEKQVPMMSRRGEFPATQTSRYSAAELPYGRGDFSMVVVVPREGISVDELVDDLDSAAWDSLISALEPNDGYVYLPRFRMEWDRTLNETLKRLGMRLAFGDADFSRLSPERGLFVSRVKQKTFVEVNEVGTEAAAVTKVVIERVSLPEPLVEANRPFLFAIRERSSGAILFVGVMRDPTKEK